MVRRADQRPADERELLTRLCADSTAIGEALELVESFASLVRGRHPIGLAAWSERAEVGTVAELRSFASRLRQDEAAVRAGLELKWSNGQTEGQVNRLKVFQSYCLHCHRPSLVFELDSRSTLALIEWGQT